MNTKKFNPSIISSILTVSLITLSLSFSTVWSNKISGAGASFPFPIYSKLFAKYKSSTRVQVNYQPIGSGGGIRQIKAETVDFGATDAFIKDSELQKISKSKGGRKLLHMPTVLGGVAITYHLPRVKLALKMDGKTLAKIFMGIINKWNDPELKKLNPNVDLPNREIIVVRRSDSSGTTATFTDFLAHSSNEWKEKLGTGKSINWFKKSIGKKSNEQIAATLRGRSYTIGYTSINHALQPVAFGLNKNLQLVSIQNNKGKFIKPTVASVSVAASAKIPQDTRINLTSTPGTADSYPISTFTWLMFYQEQNYKNRTKEDALNLKKLLTWMIGKSAQKEAKPLYYAPLPSEAVKDAKIIINSMTFNGKKI